MESKYYTPAFEEFHKGFEIDEYFAEETVKFLEDYKIALEIGILGKKFIGDWDIDKEEWIRLCILREELKNK
jgi:hypothetical protein